MIGSTLDLAVVIRMLRPKNGKLSRDFQCALNWWIGHEDMVYGMNFGVGVKPWDGDDPNAQEFSFRCLANGGRFGFTQYTGFIETWKGWVRDQNLVHGQIIPLVGRRTILPNDQGVLWRKDDGEEILFSFRSFSHSLESRQSVARITAAGERSIKLSGDSFVTQPLSVYRLA